MTLIASKIKTINLIARPNDFRTTIFLIEKHGRLNKIYLFITLSSGNKVRGKNMNQGSTNKIQRFLLKREKAKMLLKGCSAIYYASK